LALASLVPFDPGARAADSVVYDDDRVLGSAEAPITMIEYASLTCPHCADFHRDTLPRIKESWIDKDKVRFVYRHYPLDGLALRAAAVADCLEGDRFFAFLGILFENQLRWARASDPLKVLGQYAKLAGMSQARFDACVADQAEMDKILARAQDGRATYNVQSTPTLIVNGERVEGAREFENFEALFRKFVPDA